MEETRAYWRRCSSCKKEIPFASMYYVCSVSTCRHPRTGYVFCSPACWDAHLGYANHRGGAWAEEAQSPAKAEESALKEGASRAPVRKVVQPGGAPAASGQVVSKETLVVVSKVKGLIAQQSSFSTSQCCIDALSKRIAEMCIEGIAHARAAGRKTVMGRDIK